MKKIIITLSLLFVCGFLNAAQINFLDNPAWKTVLEKAKKENKIIFLDAYAVWCGPCKNMDAQIYTDPKVADFYNANFINVKYDMEKGEGPKLANLFQVTAYPSLLFINTEGKVIHKGIGFKPVSSFLELGNTAKQMTAGYLTLKQKVFELNNAEFKDFALQAKALDDDDLPQICEQYLAMQPDILGNADLIEVVMTAVNLLPTEKQLAYFAANKAKITSSGKYSEANVSDKLVGLTLGYALSVVAQKQDEKINFEVVKALLEKYVPERAFFVLHYYQTQYSFEQNNLQEALKAFNSLLANTPTKLSFEQMCMAVINFGPQLMRAGELKAIFAKFDEVKIPENEAKMSYLRDYAKAIIYVNVNDLTNFRLMAKTLLQNPTTPDKLKEDVKAYLSKIGE